MMGRDGGGFFLDRCLFPLSSVTPASSARSTDASPFYISDATQRSSPRWTHQGECMAVPDITAAVPGVHK